MRLRSSATGWLGLLLLACVPAHAAVHLAAAKLTLPGMQAQRVSMQLANDPSGALHLVLHIDALDVPALGWHALEAGFDGRVTRLSDGHWQSHGALKLAGAPGAALRHSTLALDLDIGENTLHVELTAGRTDIDLALPLDQLTHIQIQTQQLPLAWLQGMLVQVWAQGKLVAGRVDAKLAVDIRDAGLRCSGSFHLHGAGFDSSRGTIAAQSLSGSGKWRFDGTGKAATLSLDAGLDGGDVLLGPLYAALPEHAAQLHVGATFGAGVRLSSLRFDDGDALQLAGSLTIAPDGGISAIELQHFSAQFPAAYERYAKTWLATMGYAQITSDGALSGSLAYARGGLQSFILEAAHVDASDADGRLAVTDLDGRLDWARNGVRDATRLAWRRLQLLHLPLGAASTGWRSRDGALMLIAPTTVSLLGGQLFLQQLDWRPAASATQDHLAAAVAVTDVDLPALCEVLGWPQFEGALGGAIPGLHYSGERVELSGGLSLHVFDGFVNVTHVSLQHPFGSAPLFKADIALQHLDMEPLTATFQFGTITGRLDGYINDLRLVNWKPVAFDAMLRADGGGRISQRAISSLSNLGGGLGGGLQSAVLKLFKSFGYDRIGLSCELHDEVCQMGGVAPQDGGYTIVDGRGLPHIEVIGHQRKVDWPTLVARLKAATEGNGPTIE